MKLILDQHVGSRIDTHRHLGGSIPPKSIYEIMKKKTNKRVDINKIRESMIYGRTEEPDFTNFLSKFNILNKIKWTEEDIDYSISCVVDQFKQDNLDIVWLDFTIGKYMNIKWSMKQAIMFIYESFKKFDGVVKLILSIKYEDTHDRQLQYASLIDDSDLADILFGIDLVGDECRFDPKFHSKLVIPWVKNGKMVRAHLTEIGPASNILPMIDVGVTHIAHGIGVVDDNEVMSVCKDNDIVFDLGITSNYLTNAVDYGALYHPVVGMLYNGLKVTIGTDDPVQCCTNLDNEYKWLRKFDIDDSFISKIAFESLIQTNRYNHQSKI